MTELRSTSAGDAGRDTLRTLVASLADGVVVVTRGGYVRFVNPAAEALFGRPADELVDEPFGHPLLSGETAEIELLRPGGRRVTAELRTVEAEWEGEPVLLVSLRDITERREAERRARDLVRAEAARDAAEAAARRSAFLAEVGAAVAASLDERTVAEEVARIVAAERADLCVVDLRDAAGSLYHAAAASTLGELKDVVRRPADLPLDAGAWPAQRVAARGRAEWVPAVTDRWIDACLPAPAGRDAVERIGARSLLAVPLRSRGSTLGAMTWVAVRGDAAPFGEDDLALAEETARRAAAAIDNARLYQESQTANRAKSEFLAVMSHELRTPLNAIVGYADLLDAGVAGEMSEAQRTHVKRIATSGRHLAELVEEVLSFSRMEAGRESIQAEPVDLRDVVREVEQLAEPLVRDKAIRLEVDVPGEPLVVHTDPGKVRQILLNLASNAAKFTDDGSVRIEVRADGGPCRVTVRDTGIGIDGENLERIFDPFWQVEQSARRSVGGTGLGLAVARRLARMLGGDLTVESVPGDGSAFTLSLPVDGPADDEAAGEDDASSPAA